MANKCLVLTSNIINIQGRCVSGATIHGIALHRFQEMNISLTLVLMPLVLLTSTYYQLHKMVRLRAQIFTGLAICALRRYQTLLPCSTVADERLINNVDDAVGHPSRVQIFTEPAFWCDFQVNISPYSGANGTGTRTKLFIPYQVVR